MKKRYDELELLSAYIDGELSSTVKKELEERIALSADLQKQHAGLKKIKENTKSAFKPLPDSPYFETRLFAEINSRKPILDKFKKWMPIIGAAAATLILMVLLKYYPQMIDEIVEEQAQNIAGFYKENLQPLLLASSLSNEDVFNFALNRRLPLDQQKTNFLVLGSQSEGEYFEIKQAVDIRQEDDYETFIRALKLNQKQKLQMDSILGSYRDELETQVLANENNTLAINSNLWNYSKAITADLMLFAKEANKNEFAKIIPSGYNFNDEHKVITVVNRVRTMPESQYIFFTPDTIFKSGIDKEELKKDLRELKKLQQEELRSAKEEMRSAREEIKKAKELNLRILIDKHKSNKYDKHVRRYYHIQADSNVFRVDIPEIEIPDITIPEIELPDMEELERDIEMAAKQFRDFSISVSSGTRGKNSMSFRINSGDSNNNFNINVPMPNIDSILKSQNIYMDSTLGGMNKFDFHFDHDSSGQGFKIYSGDSLLFDMNIQMRSLKEDMEEFQKEMRELKEELQKESIEINKDIQNENKKKKKNSGIEI